MTSPGKSAHASRSRAEENLLASRDNRWLKEFRMALRGALPTDRGSVGVEGPRLVEEALRSGCGIEAVLFSQSGERHQARLAPHLDPAKVAFPVLRTSDHLFEGVADTEAPQGVAALVLPHKTSFDEITQTSPSGAAPFIAILVGVQDPGNVGTILRAAAAFGVTAAVTTASGQSGSASPFSPKALRASAGAALHLPILVGMALPILLAQLRVAGIRSLASTLHATHESQQPLFAPWEVHWRDPVALLVGNEGSGLPEEVERSADALLRIPMSSGVESLNAAAAAAILFYEAARQRNSLLPQDITQP